MKESILVSKELTTIHDDFTHIMLVLWMDRVSYGWWEATTDQWPFSKVICTLDENQDCTTSSGTL
jgi:hypothetical protein